MGKYVSGRCGQRRSWDCLYLITEKEDDKNQETVMDKKTFEAWEFETFDPDKILEIPIKYEPEEDAAIQP